MSLGTAHLAPQDGVATLDSPCGGSLVPAQGGEAPSAIDIDAEADDDLGGVCKHLVDGMPCHRGVWACCVHCLVALCHVHFGASACHQHGSAGFCPCRECRPTRRRIRDKSSVPWVLPPSLPALGCDAAVDGGARNGADAAASDRGSWCTRLQIAAREHFPDQYDKQGLLELWRDVRATSSPFESYCFTWSQLSPDDPPPPTARVQAHKLAEREALGKHLALAALAITPVPLWVDVEQLSAEYFDVGAKTAISSIDIATRRYRMYEDCARLVLEGIFPSVKKVVDEFPSLHLRPQKVSSVMGLLQHHGGQRLTDVPSSFLPGRYGHGLLLPAMKRDLLRHCLLNEQGGHPLSVVQMQEAMARMVLARRWTGHTSSRGLHLWRSCSLLKPRKARPIALAHQSRFPSRTGSLRQPRLPRVSRCFFAVLPELRIT